MADETPTDGLTFDRSRITHKQSKRAMQISLQVQKAVRDLDDEALTALLEEMDAMTRLIVTGVPVGWLPKGVTLAQEDWLDHLPQDKYELLTKLMQPEQPSDPKA